MSRAGLLLGVGSAALSYPAECWPGVAITRASTGRVAGLLLATMLQDGQGFSRAHSACLDFCIPHSAAGGANRRLATSRFS